MIITDEIELARRRAAVADWFDQHGISTGRTIKPWPVPTAATLARVAATEDADGFLQPPGSFKVSPALAKMLHYVERPAPRAPLTPGAAVDGETASLEEQFR